MPAVRFGAKWTREDIGDSLDDPRFTGNTYFVKKSTDADYSTFLAEHQRVYSDGTAAVYTTADLAFAAAGANDRIIFKKPDSGGHDLTETIVITQLGLKVYGEGNTPYVQDTMIKLPASVTDVDMFVVKADKVEFFGLNLQNRKAGACIVIGDTAGQAYYQIHIHNCNLTDYGGVATYGVTPAVKGGASNDQVDPVNMVIENCFFSGFVTAAIVSNGSRDAVLDNHILVPDSGIGIHLNKTANGRGYGSIKRNYIQCLGTSSGIVVTNVGSAANYHCIAENMLQGATTKITTQTNLQGYDNNEAAAATGAKTAIDIVT
jgi:hypothetical protein